MRAAVFHAANDIRTEETANPGPLAPDEVLIRPALAGICGTDLHEFTDGPILIPVTPHPLNGAQAPQILGHEFSATVVDVGTATTSVRCGDRVGVLPASWCGNCAACLRGQHQVCSRLAALGLSSPWGGLGELAVTKASQLTILPENVSLVQAALLEPAAVAATAVGRSRLIPGGSMLIVGGGPIGALSALYAHVLGVAQIVISEPNAKRRHLLETLEVATVLDPTVHEVLDIVRDRTGGYGVDAALEAAGNETALNLCIDSVRPQGVVVQTALHSKSASIEPLKVAMKDISIEGTWCYQVWEWPRLVQLVATGRFPIEKIVTKEIQLDELVSDGFNSLLNAANGDVKILVDVQGTRTKDSDQPFTTPHPMSDHRPDR